MPAGGYAAGNAYGAGVAGSKSNPTGKVYILKTKFILPALALAIICSVLTAAQQGNKTPDISRAKNAATAAASTDTSDKKDNKISLALTEAERKALEPLQAAAIEANQELIAAGDALDAAKAADVLAAAWRWKAALTAFKGALKERGNWIATTGKAHDCAGCELNLQTGEFVKATK